MYLSSAEQRASRAVLSSSISSMIVAPRLARTLEADGDQPNVPRDVFTRNEILAEVRKNPEFDRLNFTRLPDWVSSPGSLTKPRSSIAFAFEDPYGAKARSLRQADLYLFGAAVTYCQV